MYRIESDNFKIEIIPKVYEDSLRYPINTTLNVRIVSYGFSVEVSMDVGTREMANFSSCLKKLYPLKMKLTSHI